MKIIKKKLGDTIPVVKNEEQVKNNSKRSSDLVKSFLKCSSCNHKLNCENCTCQCPNNKNIIQTKGVEHEILTRDQIEKIVMPVAKSVEEGITLQGFTRDENGNLIADKSLWKLIIVDGQIEIVHAN